MLQTMRFDVLEYKPQYGQTCEDVHADKAPLFSSQDDGLLRALERCGIVGVPQQMKHRSVALRWSLRNGHNTMQHRQLGIFGPHVAGMTGVLLSIPREQRSTWEGGYAGRYTKTAWSMPRGHGR